MDANKTGRFIAELRKQQGFTQKELAERLKVTDKAISRWETGKGLPDTSLLKPLAEALSVSVSDLLAGKIIDPAQIKEQTDKIILDSLHYQAQDQRLKVILRHLLIGVFVALGGVLFSAILDRFFTAPDSISASVGLYLCIVVVSCTGIITSHIDNKI